MMVRVSAIFWEQLPNLRFVQFPWRWMALLAAAFAFLGAAAVMRKGARWAVGVAAVFALAGTASSLVHKAWWDSEDIPVLREAIASGQGFEGTDEYDPVGDDHTDLPVNAERVQILSTKGNEGSEARAKVAIQKWTAEERILTVTSNQSVRVAVRLLNYPAWRVEVVHEGKASPGQLEKSSVMILRVPGGESLVRASFERTWDRKVGIAGSAIGLLALFLILGLSRGRAGLRIS